MEGVDDGDKSTSLGVGTTPRCSTSSLDDRQIAAVILRVRVKPNSRTSSLIQEADGSWRAQLKAPPVDGKANAELVALVAEHFQCSKASVVIKSGGSGRNKLVRVGTS
jgi:uncharacterized protein (TIGR00251 family)